MSVMESTVKSFNKDSRYKYGLSEKEAEKKFDKYGPNTLTKKKKISPLKILIDQFSDFMVLILLASTLISACMGEVTEAITIISIVVVNAILGFIQEYRTEKTLEALKNLAAPTAKVVRNGKTVEIPAERIVPGDLIIIEAGDRVPADAVLIEANGILADESLLTGESVPVEKFVEVNGNRNGTAIEKNSSIYMGTIVAGGRGKAIVCATGMLTEMGKIADMIQNIETEETPLQKRLDSLGRYVVFGCLAICAVVSITGVLRGQKLFTMLLSGISLAVAAVPEGLPAIVTIALALGVRRMLKRNAMIRKLPAVETLGCASVICSDKTGTLTENKMTVRKIYSGGGYTEVRGSAMSSEGEFISFNRKINPLDNAGLKQTIEIGVVCNNASMVKIKEKNPFRKISSMVSKQEKWELSGDPTEVALLVAGAKGGFTQEFLGEKYFRIDEIPFDSDRKCMSVICENNNGEIFVFTKGAPDVIINKCAKIYTSKGIVNLDDEGTRKVLKANDSMADEALRVLGVAYRKLGSRSYKNSDVEKNLIFVGLIGMIDPPRKEVLEAVRKCRFAGIKPVMITGDHKITAAAIARELNIATEGDRVVTGAELEQMDDKKLQEVVEEVPVYARVSPRHKLRIVRALKKRGHIVAMTGDGVNDAPAIKEADIGVSMGITGTDVTKESAAMILRDDNFATIVAAIEEGRVIYSNIRKFIRYLLSCNIGEVFTMFVGMLIGFPLPLLPIQVLWVNLVTDGLPAIALGFEPAEKDIMMRPPRGAKENIFSQGLLNLILFRGVIIGVSTLAVFASIFHFTSSVETARTAAFVTLVMTQLMHVFECKSERKNIFEVPFFNNIALVLATMCSLTMILSAVYIPFMQEIFKTVPLSVNDWILIGGFSAVGPVVSSFFRVNARYIRGHIYKQR